MQNPLIRKLESYAPLAANDRRLLDEIVRASRVIEQGATVIREGEEPTTVHLVVEGFACRQKFLPEGRRQILAYLIPGDFCDLYSYLLRESDHDLATMSECRIVDIPSEGVRELTERPHLWRALWWSTLVDQAVLRAWIVNLGTRTAVRRIAHLFCEMITRLQVVGLAQQNTCFLPLTQVDLGDTLGLSVVHINRSLQQLRDDGLIVFNRRHLEVPDFDRLVAFAAFDPLYLHLKSDGVSDQIDARKGSQGS